MTTYEHAMVGIDGALALGLQRRHGWQIVALAGLAANLPDCDGLTILFGVHAYAEGHRVWAHNLLIAGLLAAIVSDGRLSNRRTDENPAVVGKRWPMFAVAKSPAEMPASSRCELYCGSPLALWRRTAIC